MLTALIDSVDQKKAQLDRARPLSAVVLARLRKHYLAQLRKHFDIEGIELNCTSIAIEGNTLTLRDTAEIIEHGITVRGYELWDYCDAIDQFEAVPWMRELATLTAPIGESTVCELHRRIFARSEPEIAGIYRQVPLWIVGSPVVFPDPAKVPHLMAEFDAWLKAAPPGPSSAFEAHFRLTAIHPFDEGNGRTARLLMNLLLIRGGYPPVAVRPEDRETYDDAMKRGSLAEDLRPFRIFMHERLDATLREYLTALQEALPHPEATAPQTTGAANETPFLHHHDAQLYRSTAESFCNAWGYDTVDRSKRPMVRKAVGEIWRVAAAVMRIVWQIGFWIGAFLLLVLWLRLFSGVLLPFAAATLLIYAATRPRRRGRACWPRRRQ